MDEWRISFYVEADNISDVKDKIDRAQNCVGASGNYNYTMLPDGVVSVLSCYFNYGETGDEAFADDDICDGIFEHFDAHII